MRTRVRTVSRIAMSLVLSGSLAAGATALQRSRANTHLGRLGAGQLVHASTSARPPRVSLDAQKSLQRSMVQNQPSRPVPKFPGPFAVPSGPAARPLASRSAPAAPTSVSIFRNTTLPASTTESGIDEPSTDANGKYVFATGNWYAAKSTNNGSTWTFLDPFTLFGSGFCCDQVTVYDVGRNLEVWLLQYSDGHLVLATSPGNNLTTWCAHTITTGQLNITNAGFDYNHMVIDTSNLFISTNIDLGNNNTDDEGVVLRIPLDTLVATSCGTQPSFLFYGPRTTDLFYALAKGAGDTMYFGTATLFDVTTGSNFRVFRWPDNSTSVSVFTRAIDAFGYMTRGQGRCGSTDGVVTNWCERTDSRMGSAYVAFPSPAEANSGPSVPNDAILGFAFNAKQDANHVFPYIRRIYFKTSNLGYAGYSELTCNGCAMLYPDTAPDSRGHLGIVWAWGGGSGTTHYYPGAGFTIDDDVTPAQPWASSFYLFGSGNACTDASGNLAWGDYLTVNALSPARDAWIGTGYALNGNASDCGTFGGSSVAVHNVIFGRERDRGSVTRWWNG